MSVLVFSVARARAHASHAATATATTGTSAPLGSAPAVNGAARPQPPPPPPPAAPAVITKKLVIVGGGVAGVTTGFRAATKMGADVLLMDERTEVGGKSQSVCLSTPLNRDQDLRLTPTCTPTHAEQYRAGDVIGRCMASAVGAVLVKRGVVGARFDLRVRGYDCSGNPCFGNEPNTGPISCPVGRVTECTAPNGYLNLTGIYGPDLVNPCGDLPWTACSYADGYDALLMSRANMATIVRGESFPAYVRRIVGVDGAALYADIGAYAAYLMSEEVDAKWAVDYLHFDYGYSYSGFSMPHGGPQVGVLARAVHLMVKAQATVRLGERVVSISSTVGAQAAAFPINITSSTGSVVLAERLVLAVPLKSIGAIAGDVAEQLASTSFVQYSGYQHTCSMNMFFPTKFWEPYTVDNMNSGYIVLFPNWTLPAGGANRSYVGWTVVETSSPTPNDALGFLQYIPTPERQEGNLLRFFFESADECNHLMQITAGKPAALKTEFMRRLRLRFPKMKIPEPVQYVWSNEPLSYPFFYRGAPHSAADLRAWAVNPLPASGKRICVASEGVSPFHNGWMEGAAESAHYCLGESPVFADIFISDDVTSFETCSAVSTRKGTPKKLKKGNAPTETDFCLLLKNEYNMRDFYRVFCGGPSVYDYPTATELFNGTYLPSSSWADVTSDIVTETNRRYRSRHGIDN